MAKKPTEKTVATPDVEETYLNKTVSFEDGEETITGTVTTIDADGILTIETEDGTKYEAEPKDVKLVEDDEEDDEEEEVPAPKKSKKKAPKPPVDDDDEEEEEEEEEVKPTKKEKVVKSPKVKKEKVQKEKKVREPKETDLSKHAHLVALLKKGGNRKTLVAGMKEKFPSLAGGTINVILYDGIKFGLVLGIIEQDGDSYKIKK